MNTEEEEKKKKNEATSLTPAPDDGHRDAEAHRDLEEKEKEEKRRLAEEEVPVIDWQADTTTTPELVKSIRAAADFLRTRTDREAAAAAAKDVEYCNWRTHTRLWGRKGDTAFPQIIEAWLELLCAVAASGLSSRQLAEPFDKSCTGCMIYTVLNAVGAHPSEAAVASAVDLFRRLLADEKGAIMSHEYVRALSRRVYGCVRPRPFGDYYRSNCLELSVLKEQALQDIVEGLAVLINNDEFQRAMATDPERTANKVKEMIESNDISSKTVLKEWPRTG